MIELYALYLNPLAISGTILFLLLIFRNLVINKIGFSWWIYILGYIAIYFTIVWCVGCSEYILQSRLSRFDLNGDGIFSGEEITIEQQEALQKVANDTARKFSIYTGLVYSGVITMLCYMVDLIKKHIWNRYVNNTNS